MAETRAVNLARFLKILLRFGHRPHAQVEKKLGWKSGTIDRILADPEKMTLQQLMLLLGELKVRLDELSTFAFPPRSRRSRSATPISKLLEDDGLGDLWDV
jgi:hypothetical protein